ncbi:hypothetical protein BAG01nite_30290 [Brevibacillus agri]|uniref:Uncharacterized protein n=1 Tax=Brevibacillus agri TaxID=51101 RepID=A0ABQ0SSP4_9BACL|nr:hypothetical protein BAG01nite_30290 [Brevibacillus agri]
MQDKRIVVIRFLQIGELGDELYFFHTLSTLSFSWCQKKLLIYHIRALGEIFRGLFAFFIPQPFHISHAILPKPGRILKVSKGTDSNELIHAIG